MPQPLDVEERLRRHAQSYRRDVTPPADLHRQVMAYTDGAAGAHQNRPVIRELAIAFAVVLFIALLALGFSRLRSLTQPQAAQHGHPNAVAASAIPWTSAAPTPEVRAVPSAVAVNQIAPLLTATVTGASPVLLPSAIPAGYSATVAASENDFDVRYTGPSNRVIDLAIVVPNPPPPGPNGTQSAPRFHGDSRSLYQVDDATQARSHRWLMWTEPGVWNGNQVKNPGVDYFLSADGLTDAEFWRIANSLQAISSALSCGASDISPAFGGIHFIGDQPFVTVYLINHGKTPCYLQGVPQVALQQASGQIQNLPAGSWDSGADPTTKLLLRPDPGITVIPGLAYVRFSQLPCTGGVSSLPPVQSIRITVPGIPTPLTLSANGRQPFTLSGCAKGLIESSVNAGRLSAWSSDFFHKGAAALQAEIRAPQKATIGQPLRYAVILTNMTSRPFTYDSCPTYVETLGTASVSSGHFQLNCGPITVFLPGESLAFDMQLDIPTTASPGTYLLTWSMDEPFTDVNGGADVTLTH